MANFNFKTKQATPQTTKFAQGTAFTIIKAGSPKTISNTDAQGNTVDRELNSFHCMETEKYNALQKAIEAAGNDAKKVKELTDKPIELLTFNSLNNYNAKDVVTITNVAGQFRMSDAIETGSIEL